MKVRIALLCGVALLAACGGRAPQPRVMYDGACVSMADDIKTLKVGDELPRVMQVLGTPAKTYRVRSPFGRTYDVLEYKVGGTPCTKTLLGAPDKLEVLFDSKGGYVGSGREAAMRLRRAMMVRVEPLVVDPAGVFKP